MNTQKITRHAYRCGAYLVVLASEDGRTLADVDQLVHERVEAGTLVCTCYVSRQVTA